MEATTSTIAPAIAVPTSAPRLHHIAVETSDLDNCETWYRDFFGCHLTWSLSSFSELTLSRLPGMLRLIEMVVGGIRFHIFERAGEGAHRPARGGASFQHICFSADSHAQLVRWRDRWLDLFASGRYVFALPETPTEIVVDASGIESFYTLDVNGLEFEFTYVPRDV